MLAGPLGLIISCHQALDRAAEIIAPADIPVRGLFLRGGRIAHARQYPSKLI
jgi:hypothetical protein